MNNFCRSYEVFFRRFFQEALLLNIRYREKTERLMFAALPLVANHVRLPSGNTGVHWGSVFRKTRGAPINLSFIECLVTTPAP